MTIDTAIDRDQVRRFLAALIADDPQTWQVFADRAGSTVRPEHRHCTLAAALPWMERAQSEGAGVFWTVQQTDGQGRRASNITQIRYLYVDCDRGPPDAWHVEPACVVQTSPGKQHAYWGLSDRVSPAQFLAAQKRLIAHYGSDPSCHDLPRVMRLPGSWHLKGAPFHVHLVAESPWGFYPLAAVLDGLAELPVAPSVSPEQVAARAARVHGGMVAGIDVSTLDIVALFGDAGLLLDTQRNGGHGVTCPWTSEHTGPSNDTAAMIWPAGDGRLPGFKCHHAHCDGRRLADVMRLFRCQLANYAQPQQRPHRAIERAEALRARARMPT